LAILAEVICASFATIAPFGYSRRRIQNVEIAAFYVESITLDNSAIFANGGFF